METMTVTGPHSMLLMKCSAQRHHEAHRRDAVNPHGNAQQEEVAQPDGMKEGQGIRRRETANPF